MGGIGPIVTTGYTVDEDAISILVFRFVGEYLDEADAAKMREDTDALLDAHPEAHGMVLDATALSYTSGKGLDDVVRKGRPRAWAGSSRRLFDFIESDRGLFPEEWIFPSLSEAVAAVRGRVVADCYEIHAADGTTVVETARREPRGRRHHVVVDEHGEQVSVSTLFDLHGTVVEVIRKRADGTVIERVENPVRDALGNENEARRVGGQLVSRRGTIEKVELNPLVTKRPLGQDWVERVAAIPTLREVSLDKTDATTADILRLLERHPPLQKLYLNCLRLDAELFTSPLLGKLHELQLHQVEAPPGAIEQLAASHPWVDIYPEPPADSAGTPEQTPRPPLETSGRSVDRDGVPILVVRFVGEYDAANAARMKNACVTLLAAHPDSEGIVLDATDLSYASGKEIGDVVGEGRPYAWVVSRASRGLFDFIRSDRSMAPREWLFPSVDDALAAVRAQVVADAYDVHGTAAILWHTWKREPRGRRKCGYRVLDDVRVKHEELYGPGGRLVEEVYRRADGTVPRLVELPIRDAAGGENAACRLGTSRGLHDTVAPPGAIKLLAATYPTIDIHPKSALA